MAAMIVAVLGDGDVAGAVDGHEKQVLVLYSTRRDAQLVVVGDREIPRRLEAGLSQRIDYYSEHIDRARFPDPNYRQAFHDFLRLKYRGHRFDLVIAMSDDALKFLEPTRRELFGDVPVVFAARNRATARIENSAGLLSEQDFAGTLTLALQLQPDTRNVFVVSGADEIDKLWAGQAAAQLRAFESRVNITHLAGLASNDLETQLAHLPDHSLVYYLIVFRDGTGENFHPLEYVERVVAAANAPTYSWVDSVMGQGIVGGSLKNQEAEVGAVASLALRVLRGERADTIPMSSIDASVRQVDWRALRRWRISAARVPAGVLVRFREPSAWDRYRSYILGTTGVLLAETALIAALLTNRARRRRAEQALRAREASLQESHRRIRRLAGGLIKAQEAVRAEIARDLHDGICQELVGVSMTISTLKRSSGSPDSERTRQTLASLERSAQNTVDSVRRLSHELHPASLRLLGLAAALKGHCLEVEKRHGIHISFGGTTEMADLPLDVAVCLFRIAQEALRNGIVHGSAKRLTVSLARTSAHVELIVTDDGCGFDLEAVRRHGGGLGLVSIEERAHAVGATAEIVTGRERGTTILIRVPTVRAEPANAADAPMPIASPRLRRRVHALKNEVRRAIGLTGPSSARMGARNAAGAQPKGSV